jgi:hypothetical protein
MVNWSRGLGGRRLFVLILYLILARNLFPTFVFDLLELLGIGQGSEGKKIQSVIDELATENRLGGPDILRANRIVASSRERGRTD